MTKPDIIISWPNNCDYPLWRQFIRNERHRFNLVIIVFTETNQQPNYSEFVKKAMERDYCLFITNPPLEPHQDWRDVAIKQALIHSFNSEWVWFTEQDFYITNPEEFWKEVNEKSETNRIVGVMDHERLHPCSIFMKRNLINWLKKDFSANPPYYDHFGYIQKQLKAWHEPTGILTPANYLHMNGLSHNWRLVQEGGSPNYRPDQFIRWITDCMSVSVPLDPRWKEVVKAYLDREK